MQQRISTGMPVAVSPERALIPHAHSRTSDPKNSRHGFFIHRYRKHVKPMTSATCAPRASSAAWLEGVLAVFETEGLDVPLLLRDAGIDKAELIRQDARFPVDQITHLW